MEKNNKEEENKVEQSLSECLKRLYQKRKTELKTDLAKYDDEVQNLPQILKIRMDALKEVNPEYFSDSPELVLSTLAASHLIQKLPQDTQKITKEDLETAHKKYNLDRGGDVNPYLVSDLVFSYFDDVKNGAINSDGKIVNIKKSEVMKVVHNSKDYGIPANAKNTMAQFDKKKNNWELFRKVSKELD